MGDSEQREQSDRSETAERRPEDPTSKMLSSNKVRQKPSVRRKNSTSTRGLSSKAATPIGSENIIILSLSIIGGILIARYVL